MNDTENPEEDYLQTFVDRVKATRQVWGLSSQEDGWAYCTSDQGEDTDVILFWSDEDLARAHQKDEWAGHVPTPVDLDTFIDHWLQGMNSDGVFAGPNWDTDLVGLELSAKELADQLLDHGDSDENS